MSKIGKAVSKSLVLSTKTILDERLSMKDLGLLVRLMAADAGDDISINLLHECFPAEGRNNINAAFENLKDFGYVEVQSTPGGMIWDIHAEPVEVKKEVVPEAELDPEPEVADELPEIITDDEAKRNAEELYRRFSPQLKAAVGDWIAYKKERRQGYKPVGMRNLMTQLSKASETYGDEAVIHNIRNSIASNYQGITFDKMSKPVAARGNDSRLSYLMEVDLE